MIGSYAGLLSSIAPLRRIGKLITRKNRNMLEKIDFWFITPFTLPFIKTAISKEREFLTDETGAKILKNSSYLASALAKLNFSNSQRPFYIGNDATSHMFIVNPRYDNRAGKLFSTHPTIAERVGKLRTLSFDHF